MKGAELGLEQQENSLYKEVDEISKKLLEKFNLIKNNDLQFKNLSSNVIEKTRNIFTTPNINFYVQELDEAKLQQCFNYINRKFGSQY